MSDNDSGGLVIKFGLPWVAVVIGGLSGWVAMESMEGMLIGVMMGVVVSITSYFGLIPIAGPFIYTFIVRAMFDWAGVELPILFFYGLVFSILYTALAVFVLVILFVRAVGDW